MEKEKQLAQKTWLIHGLKFSLFMFIILELLLPFLMSEDLSTTRLLRGAIIWIVAGLGYGYWMYKLVRKN